MPATAGDAPAVEVFEAKEMNADANIKQLIAVHTKHPDVQRMVGWQC